MKALALLIIAGAIVSTPFAESKHSSAKGDKAAQPTASLDGDCFAPGVAFGIYRGGILDREDQLSGGVLGECIFSQDVGIQASDGVFASDSEHHEFDRALVLRYPIRPLFVAPYALVGSGFETNRSSKSNLLVGGCFETNYSSEGNVLVGGGIDGHLETVHRLGTFADGASHCAGGDQPDDTIVRLGLKFPF